MLRARLRKGVLNSHVCLWKRELNQPIGQGEILGPESACHFKRRGRGSGCQGQQGGVENENMSHFPFPIQFLSPVTAARGQASVLVELQGPSKTADWKKIDSYFCIHQPTTIFG